jgi:hypothetical protein
MIRMESSICALCNRQLAEPFNRHHLIPLSKGGKGTTTISLHKICHDKIHSVFTEKELKRFYHTMERIRANEDIAKFIGWVSKKEPRFYDRSSKSKKAA